MFVDGDVPKVLRYKYNRNQPASYRSQDSNSAVVAPEWTLLLDLHSFSNRLERGSAKLQALTVGPWLCGTDPIAQTGVRRRTDNRYLSMWRTLAGPKGPVRNGAFRSTPNQLLDL